MKEAFPRCRYAHAEMTSGVIDCVVGSYALRRISAFSSPEGIFSVNIRLS